MSFLFEHPESYERFGPGPAVPWTLAKDCHHVRLGVFPESLAIYTGKENATIAAFRKAWLTWKHPRCKWAPYAGDEPMCPFNWGRGGCKIPERTFSGKKPTTTILTDDDYVHYANPRTHMRECKLKSEAPHIPVVKTGEPLPVYDPVEDKLITTMREYEAIA